MPSAVVIAIFLELEPRTSNISVISVALIPEELDNLNRTGKLLRLLQIFV